MTRRPPRSTLCPYTTLFRSRRRRGRRRAHRGCRRRRGHRCRPDRKSTRLNSSHSQISYAVFCLKKKKNWIQYNTITVKTDACDYTITAVLSITTPDGNLYLVAFHFFFFNDTATTEIYTLSLHDALPISTAVQIEDVGGHRVDILVAERLWRSEEHTSELQSQSNLVCRLLLEKKKKK